MQFLWISALWMVLGLQEAKATQLVRGGKEAVFLHNSVRAENHAEPLIYDSDLELSAVDCARRMVENPGWISPPVAATHPCKPGNDNQGENMLTETSFGFNKGELRYKWKHTTESWAAEQSFIKYGDPLVLFQLDRSKVGHFTQKGKQRDKSESVTKLMVWKSSKKAGCGAASNGINTAYVCRYFPPGNDYRGAILLANVDRLTDPSMNAGNSVNQLSSCQDEDGKNCHFLKQYNGNCPKISLSEFCKATCKRC